MSIRLAPIHNSTCFHASAPGRLIALMAALHCALMVGCAEPDEAPRVDLPIKVDANRLDATTTDLGYTVELSSTRLALKRLVFTVAGEVHTGQTERGLMQWLSALIITPAHAHPGHAQGGSVVGELPGRYVIDWPLDAGRELGVATLLAGSYSAANFTFDRGSEEILEASDPLMGHTALVTGEASRSGTTIRFTALIDAPEDRELIGAPFEAAIRASSEGVISLRFEPRDPAEGDSLFDGIDFEALDADGDGEVHLSPGDSEVEDAYFQLRRTLLTHDHYSLHFQSTSP